jgi:hypothetical protein
MAHSTNTIQNKVLEALAGKAPGAVISAIKDAASRTGVNFAYLVQQAAAESNFNPAAKAKTSSASGLFQFIESTWMNMMKTHGDKHGIDTQGMSRKEILALRNDPETASVMAAEFASDNEKFLNDHWGGKVGSTELYFAHFLGAGGASAFLKAHDKNPMAQAAYIFPEAAKANKNVFYDRNTGRAKTLDEVYAFFDKKFSVEDAGTIAVANAVQTPAPVPAKKPDPTNYNSVFANADTVVKTHARGNGMPYYQLVSSPVEVMLLAQLDAPGTDVFGQNAENEKRTFNLFSNARSYNQ